MTDTLRKLHKAAMPAPWAIVKYSKKKLALGENMSGASYMISHVNVDADDPLVVADFALVKYLRNQTEAIIALIEAAEMAKAALAMKPTEYFAIERALQPFKD